MIRKEPLRIGGKKSLEDEIGGAQASTMSSGGRGSRDGTAASGAATSDSNLVYIAYRDRRRAFDFTFLAPISISSRLLRSTLRTGQAPVM